MLAWTIMVAVPEIVVCLVMDVFFALHILSPVNSAPATAYYNKQHK